MRWPTSSSPSGQFAGDILRFAVGEAPVFVAIGEDGDESGITRPRWRAGELVATPVVQVPVWPRSNRAQPSENMKARAALHPLAPSAAFMAIEEPENSLSDAASSILPLRPVPISALLT